MRIFLAHTIEDNPQVRQLYQKLQEAGYQPLLHLGERGSPLHCGKNPLL